MVARNCCSAGISLLTTRWLSDAHAAISVINRSIPHARLVYLWQFVLDQWYYRRC
jgi:hypothetical protein